MKKGLNFRTIESQKEYFEAYEKALKFIAMPVVEKYVTTSFGDSHVVCCGDENNPPPGLAQSGADLCQNVSFIFLQNNEDGISPDERKC